MSNNQEEDYVIIWEAPKIEKPEFRLYYDEQGKVLFYTCEKPEGNYIVVDAQTFAESRPDVRVIDGRISTVNPAFIITKLMPDTKEGTLTASEDISIIVSGKTKVKTQKWKLRTYELK